MSSKWHTLVSQKLFLAKTLIQLQSRAADAVEREAAGQGALELAIRSQRLLLPMIADFYQHRKVQPETLDELEKLTGHDMPEVLELRALSRDPASWWNHLIQLERVQANPPVQKKTVSAENIIAIAADTGPDRSPAALERTVAAMKQFADSLSERHQEW